MLVYLKSLEKSKFIWSKFGNTKSLKSSVVGDFGNAQQKETILSNVSADILHNKKLGLFRLHKPDCCTVVGTFETGISAPTV